MTVQAGDVVRVKSYRGDNETRVVRVTEVEKKPADYRNRLRPSGGGTLFKGQNLKDGQYRSYYLEYATVEPVGLVERIKHNTYATVNNLVRILFPRLPYAEKM